MEPAILAVGVPVKTFLNANLADEVAELPMSTSTVVLPGYIVPFPLDQRFPTEEQFPPVSQTWLAP